MFLLHGGTYELRSADRRSRGIRPPHIRTGTVTDEAAAKEWFAAEHHCLLALLDHASAERWDTETWQLGLAMAYYLYRRGYWHDQLATAAIALTAAVRTGNATAQIFTHINFGRGQLQLFRLGPAEETVRTAVNSPMR